VGGAPFALPARSLRPPSWLRPGTHSCQAHLPSWCLARACRRSPEPGRKRLPSAAGHPHEALTGLGGRCRKLCTDPLRPACEATCGSVLHCRGPAALTVWPPATMATARMPLSTSVTCRCGRLTKEVPCVEATTKYRGSARVTPAVASGGAKRCGYVGFTGAADAASSAAIQQDHPCPQTCLKAAAMRTPPFLPVRCSGHPASPCPAVPGRPTAGFQCPLQRPCGHPSLHECHLAGEPCPPCAYLISKRCHAAARCLRPPLAPLLCHSGDCEAAAERQQQPACKQPCRQARQDCGHPCMLPCHHPEPCKQPPPCQEPVTLRCPCSRRIQEVPCHLTAQMGNAGLHLTVALGGEMDLQAYRELQTRGSLQCDAQCQLEKRNRQLAEALGVETDSNGSTAAAAGGGAVNLAPVYARTLLDLWKAYPSFAAMVESRLDETCSAVVSGRSPEPQHPAPNRDGRKFYLRAGRGVRLRGSADGDGHGEARPGRLPDRKLSAEAQRLFGIGGLLSSSRASIVCCRGAVSRGAPGWQSRRPAAPSYHSGRVATAYSRLPDQMDSMELGGKRGGAAGSSQQLG
uniref:R3H domain-containing protein n=1 Tax=Macrostomum lignano TaxID=282301 RepID=A0A1I8F4M3_9PLAT